ncbi:MAG: repair protein RadA [Evtepia sp.]|nr:repair protein RadA [Evtepia sp.]
MKVKTIFFCTECGNEMPKWQGQCPFCGAWNTIAEQPKGAKRNGNPVAGTTTATEKRNKPQKLSEIQVKNEVRFQTEFMELDRVLGGGAVRGSLILVGGEPGIGKSTLMLQICEYLCKTAKVLYVSGEESEQQLKMRADRLAVSCHDLYLLAENNLESLLEAVRTLNPDIIIVDSIQTLYHGESNASPGSIPQIKECTMTLMQLAKGEGITVFIISHVNKEGSIAGPKVLEHMVDCVLYFEGEQRTSYRILRAAKNRYGATNEIGMFEMQDVGLKEISNPSKMLLSGRVKDAPGSCVTCVIEGIRPVMAEIQALLVQTNFGNPRRTSNGLDYNRALLLQAVLEKRGGFMIASCDVYLNVVGGLFLNEPSIDLAVILAMASSFRDKSLPEDFVAIGEVGLTGELRSVNHLNERMAEIRRLGFSKCMLPAEHSQKDLRVPDGLHLIYVRNIREALLAVL